MDEVLTADLPLTKAPVTRMLFQFVPFSYRFQIDLYFGLPISTADTCKNCAKCDKGLKIGTNEAYNIKIKIRLGGISKIFCSCSHANMAASDKSISLKKKFLKKILLNVTNVTIGKSSQNSSKTTLEQY